MVGLGIAGIATAIRLREAGWEPVVVERAPQRRAGGYFIVLWEAGTAAARRLGVLDALGDRADPDTAVYEVNRAGRRHKGVSFGSIANGPRVLLRGDVEDALFSGLPGDVEIRYSTVPAHIVQDAAGVDVALHDTAADATTTERFDLVVGADGLRSTVRRLVFGPDANHLHPLNYMIGVCLLDDQVPGFRPHDGLVLAEPGRSAWTFPFGDRPPSLLFSYRTADVDAEFRRTPAGSVRAAFGPEPAGPTLGWLLDRFEGAGDVLFDSVHQVRMRQWHHGRVALVGDAAWCLTLYTGLGASSAIAGGDLLGTMLQRHPDDLGRALSDWNARLLPFVVQQQETVQTMRRFFTPADRGEQARRSAMLRLATAPMIGPAMARLRERSPMLAMRRLDVAAP
ncbi:FAD-dependent oxidoreductase [Pseudonocardia sp. CNS-139]|nr:FAD-dependent oxidoreductase [Pseudonocardia sp. CNS-139]